MAMHFNSQTERLKYLRGGFEEIVPEKVEKESETEKTEKKPRNKSKKGKKNDEIQAE